MKIQELLKKYVILSEAHLLSLGTVERTIRDIALEFKISEWNFTRTFFAELQIPSAHDLAFKRIVELFQGDILKIVCRNVAHLKLDRVTRHGHPEILLVEKTPPPTDEAYLGPLAVFGSHFEEESDLLNTLGENKTKFIHWVIDITDAQLHIVSKDLEFPNFPENLCK
jgi:hypothetical protein